jgi:ribonuclease BN (tRNA processing enzyme)
MFGASGAYSVLGSRLDLEIQTIDVTAVEPTSIWNENDISISAISVPHGDVPTLAYKFEFKESSIVFASDQNGSDPRVIDFIQGVGYLVIHLAGTEDATGVIADLHAKPSVWGNMATAADVGNVIISHVTAPTLQALEQRLNDLQKQLYRLVCDS